MINLEWTPTALECDTKSILGRIYINKCKTRLGDRYMIQAGLDCLGKDIKWISIPPRDDRTDDFYENFYFTSIELAKEIASKWVNSVSCHAYNDSTN